MADARDELAVADEELRVADEEVRVQQELIDSLLSGRASEELSRVRLAAALPVPVVATDKDGLVLQANPAAAALVHLDGVRLIGKPLLVMIDPADRRRVRSALARCAAGGPVERLSVTVTPRHDGQVPVDVVLLGDPDPGRPRPEPAPGLPAVPEHPPVVRWVLARRADGPPVDSAFLATLGEVSAVSAANGDLRAALARLAALIVQGIEPAIAASVLVGPPPEPTVLVSSDQVAQAADGAQHRLGGGPSWDAYGADRPVTTAEVGTDPRWPGLGRLVGPATPGVAAVPLPGPGVPAGVLTLYGTAELGDAVTLPRAALFAQAAAALLREHEAVSGLRRVEEQLRTALVSRAEIDQAKGILMARHGLDADAAFAELTRRSQHANTKLREVARRLVAEASATAVRVAPPAPRRTGTGR